MPGAVCGRPSSGIIAHLVDHLVADPDPSRSLHDLIGVAVDDRHHRTGQTAGNAAVVETAVHVRIRRSPSAARAGPLRGPVGDALLSFRRLCRDPAVGRIDNARRPAARLPAIEPVRWRRRGGPDLAGVRRVGRRDVEFGVVGLQLPLRSGGSRGELFVGDELPAREFGGTFERHALLVLVGKDAGDVRVAPRRSGRRPARLRGRRALRRGLSGDRRHRRPRERRSHYHCSNRTARALAHREASLQRLYYRRPDGNALVKGAGRPQSKGVPHEDSAVVAWHSGLRGLCRRTNRHGSADRGEQRAKSRPQ